MNQLPIDFNAEPPRQPTGRQLADMGMARALDHANRVMPTWGDLALDWVRRYAESNPTVMSEDVRAFAGTELPAPPDRRAWGGVMRRASSKGWLVKHGWTTAKDPKVHCNPVSLWRSTLCGGAR